MRTLVYRAFAVLLLSLAARLAVAATPTTASGRLLPDVDHVLIVSIDGLRPDLLLRTNTPVMHDLMRRGSFTFWARTTAVSVTLPSHTSMLTGVSPERHGIEWNRDLPLARPIYPAYATLFEVARHAGLTTAMAAGKNKFDALAKPGTIDWLFLPDAATAGTSVTTDRITTDDVVADHAAEIFRDHKPDVLFVHFPGPDVAGHAYGWGSPAQVVAIEKSDAALGRVLQADRDAGLADRTLVIVTADHGGAGRFHGPDDARSRHTPWIAAGPGVRRDFDLTDFDQLQINTEDTFATACAALGITPPKPVEGKPITEIVDHTDLMQSER